MTKNTRTPMGMVGGVMKPYDQMTTAELREATKEYDKEMLNPGRPLNARERKLHAQARQRGPGRPKIGKGVKKVMVTVESGLLRRADRYAKDHRLKRSQLVALALEEKLRGTAA